jgi:hypothetical protein
MSGAAQASVNPEYAREIHAQCERALRRLRALARERNDVLLSSAVRSISRASEISATQMGR